MYTHTCACSCTSLIYSLPRPSLAVDPVSFEERRPLSPQGTLGTGLGCGEFSRCVCVCECMTSSVIILLCTCTSLHLASKGYHRHSPWYGQLYSCSYSLYPLYINYHNLFSSLEKSTQFGRCTQKIYVMGNYTCPLPDVMEPYMQIHVGLHGRGTLEPKWYAAINF